MKEITAKELQNKMENGEVLNIIDVRDIEEANCGKIKNAKVIPLNEIENSLDELDKNKTFFVICQSGKRSIVAAQILEYENFDVVNVKNGMDNFHGEIQ